MAKIIKKKKVNFDKVRDQILTAELSYREIIELNEFIKAIEVREYEIK